MKKCVKLVISKNLLFAVSDPPNLHSAVTFAFEPPFMQDAVRCTKISTVK